MVNVCIVLALFLFRFHLSAYYNCGINSIRGQSDIRKIINLSLFLECRRSVLELNSNRTGIESMLQL